MDKGIEYEALIANLISSLDICKYGKLFRNKKYPGIHQPGHYEIDISVEFNFDNYLFFLLIVECKNWSRPIDRPAVQKLIQTRDSIGAHKAAMVSINGFTKEAADVAKSYGIACWIVNKIKKNNINIKEENSPLRVKTQEKEKIKNEIKAPKNKKNNEVKLHINDDILDVRIVGAMHEIIENPYDFTFHLFNKLERNLLVTTRNWIGLANHPSIRKKLESKGVLKSRYELLVLEDPSKFNDYDIVTSFLYNRYVYNEWYDGELLNCFLNTIINTKSKNPLLSSLSNWKKRWINILLKCGMQNDESYKLIESVILNDYNIWLNWINSDNSISKSINRFRDQTFEKKFLNVFKKLSYQSY
jgi:hypothetical protein